MQSAVAPSSSMVPYAALVSRGVDEGGPPPRTTRQLPSHPPTTCPPSLPLLAPPHQGADMAKSSHVYHQVKSSQPSSQAESSQIMKSSPMSSPLVGELFSSVQSSSQGKSKVKSSRESRVKSMGELRPVCFGVCCGKWTRVCRVPSTSPPPRHTCRTTTSPQASDRASVGHTWPSAGRAGRLPRRRRLGGGGHCVGSRVGLGLGLGLGLALG